MTDLVNKYPKIDNWSMSTRSPYQPPECSRLGGTVTGSTRFEDGEYIYPSEIIAFEGNLITTRNSIYELGEPNPEYVKFCAENDLPVPTVEYLRNSFHRHRKS